MQMTDAFLYNTGTYVGDLFAANPRSFLVYHNLAHTRDVVQHALEIAAGYHLVQRDHFVLIAAAWFHDTGHLFAEMALHEQESVRVMRNYFAEHNAPADLLDDIAACILATRMPAQPRTLLQQILCDADTYHLGTDDFWVMDELVRKEMEARFGKPMEQWKEKTYAFLQVHRYFTTYALQKLEPGKQENMRHLLH